MIIEKIEAYNDKVLAFNHKRNRIYIVLYRLPKLNEMPKVIETMVSITSIISELATVTKDSPKEPKDEVDYLKLKPMKKK